MASVNFCMIVGILFYAVFVEVVNGRVLPSNNNKNVSTKYIDGLPVKIEGVHKEAVFHEDFNTRGLSKNISLSNIHPFGQEDNYINHWATIKNTNLRSYGAKATINVYGLSQVSYDNQLSGASIWVASNEGDALDNSISAGWHVQPGLYGDNDTHFYIYTEVKERDLACYNLLCKGFVPFPSSKYIPGDKIRPLSIMYGNQYEITLKIFKDSISGDWWLHAGRNSDIIVGYWPMTLFTFLQESASYIEVGGIVGFYKGQESPPMGNGRYPHQGKAAYIKNVRNINQDGALVPFESQRFEDKTDCYQLDGDENFFHFGGPGGCGD